MPTVTVVDDRGAISTGCEDQAVEPKQEITVQHDERRWTLAAANARYALGARHAFRDHLLAYGDPVSDFHAAEVVYGELVGNCARHAPGPVRVEFRWEDATLVVIDASDRLRSWPFSADDHAAEPTHHAFALVRALTSRMHLAREPRGGTRASVVLPVRRRA